MAFFSNATLYRCFQNWVDFAVDQEEHRVRQGITHSLTRTLTFRFVFWPSLVPTFQLST